MSSPSTSRWPASETPIAMTTAIETTRPCARTFRKVASSHTYGYAPSRRRVRNRSTSASSSAQSRLTWLREIPSSPSARTRSSTRRVETPWT
jgi:hypothetical protein